MLKNVKPVTMGVLEVLRMSELESSERRKQAATFRSQ